MLKKISVFFLLLFSTFSFAQQATSSPYSFYGIGDVRFKGTVENRLMGSIAIFADSLHLNIQNPASYSSLKMTTYTVGAAFNSAKENSFFGNEKSQRSTLDYMAVGIPLGRSGIGFGLIPYSSVGYRIQKRDGSENVRKYLGSGGLNKVFVGYGYKVNENWRVGADINYNFGKIETKNISKLVELQYGAQELNTSGLSGLNFNLAAMYEHKISTKLHLFSSLMYAPESKLKSKNERILSSVLYTETFDPIDVDRLEAEKTSSTLIIPSKVTFGIGLGEKRKWSFGAEITYQESSKFENRLNDVSNVEYKNVFKYSFGGSIIPNYNAFSNYFKKITYRGGFRYENTGMVIKNESIRDYAMTAGFGLPLGGAFSNLNIGVEYGRRGTAKALLVEENYTNVIMSLSLNDRWFVKRKYE